MQTITLLNDFYQHMQWADAAVWQTIAALPAAEPDKRLRDLLYHLHITQHAFLKIWTTQPLEFPKPTDFADLKAIAAWGQTYYKDLPGFFNKIKPSALERPLEIPWAERLTQKLGKVPGPVTLGETMFQVVFHSTYHRGQVNARIRELGAEPPLTDYIGWVWLERPKPDWPEF